MFIRSSNVRSRSILPISLRSVVWASWEMAKTKFDDAVGRPLGIEHLHVKHAVHAHLDVVARDTHLRRNIVGLLLQRVPVPDHVHERHEDVESGAEDARKAAEPFDDVRALLRHDDRRLGDDDDGEEDENDSNDERVPLTNGLLLARRAASSLRRASPGSACPGQRASRPTRSAPTTRRLAAEPARRRQASTARRRCPISPTRVSIGRRLRVHLRQREQPRTEQRQPSTEMTANSNDLQPQWASDCQGRPAPRRCSAPTPKKMM